MSLLTAAVLAALGAYVAMMIGGQLPTDFALFLLLCTVVSGVYFVLDRWRFTPQREEAAKAALAEFDRTQAGRPGTDPAKVAAERERVQEQALMRPWWLEYTSGFFPVILAVFALRSFVVEPFRIPSGSMIPTLQVGDLILVNKWKYGIRLPVANVQMIEVGHPQRGDVMVFRYPLDPTQDYIKRVVGLPGDKVEYRDRQLWINGQLIPMKPDERYFDESRAQLSDQFTETLGTTAHRVIFSTGPGLTPERMAGHTDPKACTYAGDGVSCTVPAGRYFMMGDNRDNSQDSRFWGFVPEQNIVGKAFFIWMNFGHLGRIGGFQ